MRNGTVKVKFTKRDYLNIFLLSILFILFIYLLSDEKYLLGSTTDWSSQHAIIPDYFRTLFYKTHDLFPDFAFNIGAGQNIYNFAYYGLLNPIIMISYLFPKVSMVNYIIISTSILVLLSVILMYRFLRINNFNSNTSFVGSFLFMCASPLLFHLHRHIMFINYMPFLILGLIGINKYFYEHKSWLLVLNIMLMILMSYYYSVVGIIVLVIYGIYVYLKINSKITFKAFFKDGCKFAFRIILGIIMAGILIVPTAYVVLNGRGATDVTIPLKEILLPNINLNYCLYKYYGIGLGCITIVALVNLFRYKKENRFLAIALSSILVFPFFNYLFNATMYIDAKCLIPFLPLYIYITAIFLEDLYAKKLKIKSVLFISLIVLLIGSFSLESLKYFLILDFGFICVGIILYYMTDKKIIFNAIICLISFCITMFSSKLDTFVEKNVLMGPEYTDQEEAIRKITDNDNSIYRISNQINPAENTNRLYSNINYYQTTLYSSTYNKEYNKFYYDVMNNAIQSRNRVITSSAKNYPFLLLTGNKYLVTKNKPFKGYKEYFKLNDITVYKNDSVLPVGYSSSNLLSLDTFNNLGYPYNQEAILKNIIVDKKINDTFKSHVTKTDLKLNLKELEKLNIQKEDNTYKFSISKKMKIKLPLEKPLKNTLLYIHFRLNKANSCKVGDTIITINGINNKLTCNPWKYHNGNYDFDYVLAYDELKNINITFTKGDYEITDINFYTLDYEEISNINNSVDPLVLDKNLTKGDNIEGDITVSNDGYFVLSVPYDRGFSAYVDGEVTEIEKVNVSFIGFKIDKGKHHIKIVYASPGKKIGTYLSIFGIIMYIGLIIYEGRKIKNDRRIKK